MGCVSKLGFETGFRLIIRQYPGFSKECFQKKLLNFCCARVAYMILEIHIYCSWLSVLLLNGELVKSLLTSWWG